MLHATACIKNVLCFQLDHVRDVSNCTDVPMAASVAGRPGGTSRLLSVEKQSYGLIPLAGVAQQQSSETCYHRRHRRSPRPPHK